MADRGLSARQNEPHALNLLAAQRHLYSRAKAYRIGESVVTVALAAISPFVIWLVPDASQWLAAAAGGWLLLARALFGPLRHGAIRRAALVQEAFDSHVFGLPWNDALGRHPAREDVATWAGKYKPDPEVPLEDWYEPTEGSSPRQAVACQRMSIVWSRRQHHRYSTFLTAVTAIWSIVVVTVGIVLDLSLAEALVALLLPSMPAVLAGVEHAASHRAASGRTGTVEVALDEALSADPDEHVARGLQDEVFHCRRDAPLVPDWFFKRFRTSDQTAMEYGAAEFRSGT